MFSSTFIMTVGTILGVWGVTLNVFQVARLLGEYVSPWDKNACKSVATEAQQILKDYPEAENWPDGKEVPGKLGNAVAVLSIKLSGYDGMFFTIPIVTSDDEEEQPALTVYRLTHDLMKDLPRTALGDLFLIGETVVSWDVSGSFAPDYKEQAKLQKIHDAILALPEVREIDEITQRQQAIESYIPELTGKQPKMYIYHDDCHCCS